MATGRKNSAAEVVTLSLRVKELEKQVSEYKKRLDELRKAKNTTLIKTQKEMVEINPPQLGVRQTSNDDKLHDLQKQLEEQEKRHASEIAKLKASKTEAAPSCNHEQEIERLNQLVLSLEGDNSALIVENDQLKERVSSLMHQLSVKEATACEREEDYKKQLRLEWGERYKEWIEQTEKKIEELQESNTLLRTYLKNSGRMPDNK